MLAKSFLRRRMRHDISDTATVYQLLDPDVFPSLRDIFQVLTIPVSSCVCERSFSALCRLHTRFRSTMGQEKLNNLVILMTERRNLDIITREDVIDRFA